VNVLSLFDGISCGKLALERAKIKVTNYYASEIDKYAIKVSKANHSGIIYIGDVRNVTWFGLPPIDLLLAGSPCQGFSFAGKGLNFEDERSKLFFDFVRILKEIKPKYFLLENVLMKKEHENIITEHLGVKPFMINSSLLSAQSRKRNYWTNIPNITQPKDKKIMLKDIIEDGFVDRDKSLCITSSVDSPTYEGYHTKHRNQIVKLCNVNPSGSGMNGNVYSPEGKAPTVTTNKGEGNKIGYLMVGEAELPTSRQQDKRVYSIDGKSPTLLANSGGHKEPKIAIIQRPRGFNKGGNFTNKSPTLSCNSWQDNNHLSDGVYWRKLTVHECCKLQTIPTDYFTGIVSNAQAYKALGNGWTVDVVAHILKNIKIKGKL
jgi:DNA-cytosine methyltransferase